MGPEKASGDMKDAVIDFIGGSLGGVGVVYVGQPLDTIKVKLQTFPTMYRGMVHCFRQTLLNEGIVRGLYAGTVPAVVANVAENSVLFAAYGSCQKVMMYVTSKEKAEDLSTLSHASAGFLAAFFSSFTLCPTELIKCRLQAMREASMHTVGQPTIGPWQLTRQILQTEGVPGMFKGLMSTIARALRTMISGAIGGVIFWIIIFPADVVKSRIQVSGIQGKLVPLIYKIFREEGLHSLYSGLRATIVRTIPATATLFLVYENTKKVLHKLLD
ncbi:Mitochondrial ornithine transporter 1 [Blattella germanica]|nr:Mitochondrial ornithine transporter 1 [Blattella germanica]